jgi:hypothetical protein
MPTKLQITYEIRPHATLTSDLVFQADADTCRALVEVLEGVRAGGREAFVVLPPLPVAGMPAQRWETYWKRRDAEDSRLMVAHPEPNLWVATIALPDSVLGAVVGALKEGGAVRIEDLGPIHAFSNLHVTVETKT